MQCSRKTFMVHQTFVRWALYILFKFVKSLIRHLGLAIGHVWHVRWFSWTLIAVCRLFDTKPRQHALSTRSLVAHKRSWQSDGLSPVGWRCMLSGEHYLNKSWLIANDTIRTKLQWLLNHITEIFFWTKYIWISPLKIFDKFAWTSKFHCQKIQCI